MFKSIIKQYAKLNNQQSVEEYHRIRRLYHQLSNLSSIHSNITNKETGKYDMLIAKISANKAPIHLIHILKSYYT